MASGNSDSIHSGVVIMETVVAVVAAKYRACADSTDDSGTSVPVVSSATGTSFFSFKVINLSLPRAW